MKKSSTLIACLSIIILILLSGVYGYANPCSVGTLNYSVLSEYPESVLSVAYHPIHNNILAVGRSDGTIRLWNTSTQVVLHTFGGREGTVAGHTDIIFTLAFSPDGNKLVSGSADGTVRVWNTTDIENRKNVEELWKFSEHNGLVLTLAFLTEDGNILASGSQNGSIFFWNLITGEGQDVISGDAFPAVISLATFPERMLLATGRSDNIIRVWSLSDGNLKHIFNGHEDDITSLTFKSDGNMLISGSADGSVKMWDTSIGANTIEPVHEFPHRSDWVNSVALHETVLADTTLASANFNGTIMLWDIVTKNPLYTLTGDRGSVESIAFSRDGKTLASGGRDGRVLLWELTPTHIKGDVNGDGFVNLIDLDVANSRLGMTGDDTADINDDAVINIADLVLVTNIIKAKAAEYYACVSERTDVNNDKVVDEWDLKAVDKLFGTIGLSNADVNLDGIVNVIDLVLVANAIGSAAAAPSLHHRVKSLFTTEQVQGWLTEARFFSGETSLAYQGGMVVLKQLLVVLTPEATVLLPNYPNPFNPETWIPYQLAEPADVTVIIYAANGKLVRMLDLGHQSVGIYKARSRAAYWDGKNAQGEPVASGLYFYTLKAGDFTTTRRMVIRK